MSNPIANEYTTKVDNYPIMSKKEAILRVTFICHV
jgi:hypothetical protein